MIFKKKYKQWLLTLPYMFILSFWRNHRAYRLIVFIYLAFTGRATGTRHG
jgi:hypothetical protein